MNSAASKPQLIVQRVGRGLLLEPLRMLADGIAGVDEIDQIIRRLGGFRAGPFERMDAVGLGIDYALTRGVWEQLGQPARLEPHPLQAELIERGHLGRSSGRGFYVYDREPPLPAVSVDRKSFDCPPGVYKAVRRFVDGAAAEGGSFTEHYVFARTLVAVINEAALCVDENLASEHEIDTAMTGDAGYPRGPLEWAAKIGRHTCATLLRRFNERVDDNRFRPGSWLGT